MQWKSQLSVRCPSGDAARTIANQTHNAPRGARPEPYPHEVRETLLVTLGPPRRPAPPAELTVPAESPDQGPGSSLQAPLVRSRVGTRWKPLALIAEVISAK